MTQAATTPSPGKSAERVANEGYSAQAAGKDMVRDNPYPSDDANHWTWRAGFIEAFADSN